MPAFIHKFEVAFRHGVLVHLIVRLVRFNVNDWCAIEQVDSLNKKPPALPFNQAYKSDAYGVRTRWGI